MDKPQKDISGNGASLGLRTTFPPWDEGTFDNLAPQWSTVWLPVFSGAVLL